MTVFRLLVACSALAAFSCKRQVPDRVRMYSYTAVWQRAESRCVPGFPHKALAAGREGLAVVSFSIEPDGTATQIQVLQAPDEELARSAAICVSNWRMPHQAKEEPPARRGKLYFYFMIEAHRGRVLVANNPEDRKLLIELRQAEYVVSSP